MQLAMSGAARVKCNSIFSKRILWLKVRRASNRDEIIPKSNQDNYKRAIELVGITFHCSHGHCANISARQFAFSDNEMSFQLLRFYFKFSFVMNKFFTIS